MLQAKSMSAINMKSGGLLGALVCLLPLGAPAEPSLSALRSFGFPQYSAANPYAEVIEASDGRLYGTTSAGGSAGQGTIFRINTDGTDFLLLKSFGTTTNDGRRPFAPVIEGQDGALYGLTEDGGGFGFGTVFRVGKDGTDFTVLQHFAGTNGAYPEARLLQASDGWLYGTTSGGGSGTNDSGVVFRVATNGTGFQLLRQFAGTNGANPAGGLIEAEDGVLYGTTCFGGGTNLTTGNLALSTNVGTVFRMNKDGSDFTVLKHFFSWANGQSTSLQTNGYYPYGQLVQGTNGALYGTTSAGGRGLGGTIYTLNTNGTGFSFLCQLTNATGGAPLSGLALASDGMLYGTTFDGGASNSGTIFRIGEDGSGFAIVTNLAFGQGCAATVVEGSDGSLYGTTQLGGSAGDGTIFKAQKSGAGFSTLRSFSTSGGDGQSGYAGLLVASDGVLYGNTRLGGELGAGAVFSLNPFGMDYRVLSDLAPDGAANPVAALIEGTNGWLYGTSAFGGASNRGTVFGLPKEGLGLNVLQSFSTSASRSYAALVQSTNGLLYGLTLQVGTLFDISTDGSDYTTLRTFTSEAMNPMSALVQASDGNFYGTAYFSFLGGTINVTNGCIFRLDADGSNYTVLKFFSDPLTTGANPLSPLLEASDGMFYGTTYSGGTTNNAGAVFRVNKDGTGFELLRAFDGVLGDGRHPCGRLAEGADGAIYGTTERGGANDQGALFKLNKDGSGYSALASFDEGSGKYPRGGLVLGPTGALYGCTDQGGGTGSGTIFRFGSPFESIVAVSRLPGSGVSLTCLGLPGTNYWIERTLDLGPMANWLPLSATNSPDDGVFNFVDADPVAERAFYRMKR
jgi:uncharacterized repeat protein (TIGR03803 family)